MCQEGAPPCIAWLDGTALSAIARIAVLISTSVALLAVGPAHAAFPGTNGKISFTTTRDGNNEIYSMNADGSGATRLSSNAASDSQPDGNRIAFTSNRDGNDEIYVMNAGGLEPTRLTNNAARDRQPARSADGSRIAFTSDRDGNDEIYDMDATGSAPTRLTNNPASDREPAWSPDGSRIAFTSDRDGSNEIYVISVSGSDRLTNNPASDREPTWSPDGSRIAFTSNRDGNDEIYVMNADGSNPVRLTANVASDSQPAWSPDGSRIAFTSDRDGNDEIYVMNANGSDPINVTSNGMADVEADWQRTAPANDDSNLALVVGQGQYPGVLAGATPDGTSSCPGNGNPDIWYRFTAPMAGVLRADTCGTNDLGGVDAGADTVLSLHAGDGLVELACDDDWPAGIPACPGASGFLYDSQVQRYLGQNSQVLIRVTKYGSGPVKDILLNVTFDPDSDQDGIVDASDNCTLAANPTQLDADHDGYGNICDGDLNNSGLVTAQDNALLRSVLNQPASASPTAAAADLNGSGLVTAQDNALLRQQLNSAPGPSGLGCAGTVPCP